MATNSEQGHAKNVANIKDLITYATSYGTKYNPSRKALTLAELNTLHIGSEASIAALNALMPAYHTAVAVKDETFAPLSKLITKAFSNFSSCGAFQGEVDNAFTLAKKIKGQSRLTQKGKKALEEGKEPMSQSQQSMDMRVENLDRFIKILAASPEYKPNENELQVASLQALLVQLKTLSESVVTAEGPVIDARSNRDALLYTPETGLVDIAQAAKKYLRSVFPAGSEQYKKVAALKFTKPRKKK